MSNPSASYQPQTAQAQQVSASHFGPDQAMHVPQTASSSHEAAMMGETGMGMVVSAPRMEQ